MKRFSFASMILGLGGAAGDEIAEGHEPIDLPGGQVGRMIIVYLTAAVCLVMHGNRGVARPVLMP